MRIAQVIPFAVHPYSGVLVALVNLTIQLARRGHQMEAWVLHDWPAAAVDYLETLETANVEVVQIPTTGLGRRLGSSARRAIAARSIDAVHLHSVFSPRNNVIARHVKVPYVLSPHGGYAPAVLRRHRYRKLVFQRLLELPMLRRAALVCALTAEEEREVRRFGYEGPVAVVPNGVDSPASAVSRTAFRRDLGLEDNSLLAVFVGRLDRHYKRLDDLVHATARAERWQLALIGPDWQGSRRRLGALVRKLAVDDRVHFFAPRRGSHLQEALAAASVFVLMSRSEGLPLALLEALAHGVPALVSPEVELSVAVAEKGAGWVAQPGDLSHSLHKLAQMDGEAWAGARTAALELARGFSWVEAAARYDEALAQAVLSR